MRGVFGAIVAVVVVTLATPAVAEDIPGAALDPSDVTLAIEQRGCGSSSMAEPSCHGLAQDLGELPGWAVRNFDHVTATLPSSLRTNCSVKDEQIGWEPKWIFCFDQADTEQREWLTQGLAGTDEWRTGATPGGRNHFLVATWCWRGSEGRFPERDYCDANEPVKRTRVSLINVDRKAYRHVELVEPYRVRAPDGGTTVAARPILLHAGGAAIAGRLLYVADTDWIYVFNLDHFVQEGDNEYLLPVWERYVIADEADRDTYNPFSSISIDGSRENDPRLVAAEFRPDFSEEAIVSAWPLQKDGQLPPADPRIETLQTYMIDGDSWINHVQGVASRGDFFVFAESWDQIERSRVGRIREGDHRCIRWGRGTGEDLYASPGHDLLVGINESSPGIGSAFWAVSYQEAFELKKPPRPYPRRC